MTTRLPARAVLLATLAGPVALGGCAEAERREPAAHTVTIEAMRFEPASLAVTVGDTVRWRNQDLVPHTATARDGGFDSGTLVADSSWSTVVGRAGTIDYACLLHPTMAGRIVAAP